MKYIVNLREGEQVRGIYLCKQRTSAVTKNGKNYDNVILQDKTGTIDCKIWDPNSMGIADFEALDYVEVTGDVSLYNGSFQMSIKGARIAEKGEYNPSDYLPTSRKDIETMYGALLKAVAAVNNQYLKKLLDSFFVEDKEFIESFKEHSAAKTMHHGFVGGLLEHSLAVTNICAFFTQMYPILNKDLLLTAAMLHDIGKTKELSLFPQNDYTDDGQMLGHIIIGYEMISEKIKNIPDFPEKLAVDLKHCILAHHGELEYGSPKKPSIPEAFALNLADNCDAKMEMLTELILNNNPLQGSQWYGFNRGLESNIRQSSLNQDKEFF